MFEEIEIACVRRRVGPCLLPFSFILSSEIVTSPSRITGLTKHMPIEISLHSADLSL
jgi:hypothetical protein